MMSKRMWMVRAGRNAVLIRDFQEDNYVSVGWTRIEDLSSVMSKEELTVLHEEAYADMKPGNKRLQIGMLSRFRFDIGVGDYVITYNPEYRTYPIGEIISEYKHVADSPGGYNHRRDVKWIGKVDRDALSLSTKNTVGAIMTLFLLNDDARDEFLKLLSGEEPEPKEDAEEEVSELGDLKRGVLDRAFEFTKDKILGLDWEEMQELVAGILRAMGYKTRVASPGPDRGVDIVASPDGLGLEQPRIRVEVKHRSGAMGSPNLRSFIGGLTQSDRGLYVSTGGFTREARYEAERSNIPVTLIDIDELADLLIRNYDDADSETKALIPLVKLYWPA